MRLQFDPEVDYYEVLQVHQKAHPEIIKRAYRTLVAQLHAHPDLGGSHQQMVLINRAYEVLSDPELREAYDRWRQAEGTPQPRAARPSRRTSPPTAPSREPDSAAHIITAVCLKCGRRNRVPQEIGLGRARCGACGERLIPAAAARQARSEWTGAGPMSRRLPQELYNELRREGQLRVQLDRVARGSRVVCRRCRRPYWAPHSGKPPRRCPACGSDEWQTFRLFKCSQCAHEFETNSLRAWPYRVFAACPKCGSRHWNRAAERSPLRWVMRWMAREK
jgi:curved DNA-binding protein CbpA